MADSPGKRKNVQGGGENMKKLAAIIVVMMVICVSGCGAKEETKQTSEPEQPAVSDDASTEKEDTKEEAKQESEVEVIQQERQDPVSEAVQEESVMLRTEEELPENCLSVVVTPEMGYTYTVYGEFYDYRRMENCDCGVALIRPKARGGRDYTEYPSARMSCYIPPAVMDGLEALLQEDEDTVFKFTMRNNADCGGYIELPAIIVDFEVITLDEIPAWGGL